MKKAFLKTISKAALAILVLTMFAQIPSIAQDINNEVQSGEQKQENLSERRDGRALEGVWNMMVTIRNCATGAPIRTFPSMNTFIRGGVMQETGTGSSPALRSPGHGVWSYLSQQRFSSIFQFFRFASDGTYIGTQKARRHMIVRGDSLEITSLTEIFDANGNLLSMGCATEVGTRFQ